MAQAVKKLSGDAETRIDPWLEDFGGGHDHPLQYSCSENPVDEAWQAIAHGVAKSWTRLRE